MQRVGRQGARDPPIRITSKKPVFDDFSSFHRREESPKLAVAAGCCGFALSVALRHQRWWARQVTQCCCAHDLLRAYPWLFFGT
jgi:hypothetical protein